MSLRVNGEMQVPDNQISLRNQTFYTEAYFDGEKRVAYAWLQFMRFCFKLI